MTTNVIDYAHVEKCKSPHIHYATKPDVTTYIKQTVLIVISSANPLRATTHGRAVICQTLYTFQHCYYKLRLTTTTPCFMNSHPRIQRLTGIETSRQNMETNIVKISNNTTWCGIAHHEKQ